MRKLKLSRETLRQLDPDRLRAMRGGLFNKCDNTSPTNDLPPDEPCQGGDPIDTQIETFCYMGIPYC